MRSLCVPTVVSQPPGTGAIIRAMQTVTRRARAADRTNDARKNRQDRKEKGVLGALGALGVPTVYVVSLAVAQAAQAPPKIEIVSVIGCLKEATPTTWTLTSATDPVPSNANAPPPKDIPATPPAGKNEFRLIGVSEFNLPAHRDHTVVVKGLLIKATPMSRVNVTSVTMAAASCAPAPPK